jgi:hypothetical protein
MGTPDRRVLPRRSRSPGSRSYHPRLRRPSCEQLHHTTAIPARPRTEAGRATNARTRAARRQEGDQRVHAGAAGARLPACHPRRTLRSAGEMLVLVLERDWSAGASPPLDLLVVVEDLIARGRTVLGCLSRAAARPEGLSVSVGRRGGVLRAHLTRGSRRPCPAAWLGRAASSR